MKIVKNDLTNVRFTVRKDEEIVFYHVPVQVLDKYIKRAYPEDHGKRKVTTILMERGYTYTSKIRNEDGTFRHGTRSKNS